MSLDLRPLRLGELLDRIFTLYRRHFLLFVGIMAIPSAFSLALGLLMQIIQEAARRTEMGATAAPIETAVVFIGLLGGILVLGAAYWIAYMVALGATTLAVSELYLGRSATVRSAYARMRGQTGRLVWLMILMSVRLAALFIGTVAATALLVSFPASRLLQVMSIGLAVLVSIAGLLGCFYLSLRYAVSVPAVVLENLPAAAAIRRSVALTRAQLGRVLVLVVCAVIIAYASIMLFQMPFAMAALVVGPQSAAAFWFNILSAVSGAIGNTLSGPIMIIGLALLYYDIRIRKEGLDLQLMMEALDGAPDLAPVPASLPG
jgi:hypothetical protein